MEDKFICDTCGKEVKESWDLDRDGDCTQCKANARETEMTVGDLCGR